MVDFGSLESSSAVRALADGSLVQLYRSSAFATAATTSIEGRELNTYFTAGQTVTVQRPKDIGAAQAYDPRSGVDATSAEPGNVIISILLDRLFTAGFPIFSSDAQVERYVRDYSRSTGGAVRKAFDDYLYARGFREWDTLAASGDVALDGHPPVQIAFRETSGGDLEEMGDELLRSAGATLSSNEVPEDEMRYARISTRAAESYLGAITPVTGAALTEGQIPLGQQLLQQPSYMTRDFSMRGFMIRGSNAVTGQSAVDDTGDGNATEEIGAVVAATTGNEFTLGDFTTATPAGAVRLTITQTANLDAGIAVGKIARVGPDSGPATAYGVILRVDVANKFVWLVPYNNRGQKLKAAQIATATNKFGVPSIGSINPAYHKEHLAFATRLLQGPSPGSGAVAENAIDQDAGLVMQVLKGSYNVDQFKESVRTACLCGAKPTDLRKAVLMLSA
ncbi:MAG: hypothetical protein AAF773_00855 [Cyanobacteria bacterium P01_D01_bin.115]